METGLKSSCTQHHFLESVWKWFIPRWSKQNFINLDFTTASHVTYWPLWKGYLGESHSTGVGEGAPCDRCLSEEIQQEQCPIRKVKKELDSWGFKVISLSPVIRGIIRKRLRGVILPRSCTWPSWHLKARPQSQENWEPAAKWACIVMRVSFLQKSNAVGKNLHNLQEILEVQLLTYHLQLARGFNNIGRVLQPQTQSTIHILSQLSSWVWPVS